MLQTMEHAAAWEGAKSPLARFGSDERGSSAVEFALLSPVFLLLLCGMMAYGIYFGAAHSVQQLAADAARTAVAGLTRTERDMLVTAFIANNADAYPLLARQALSYAVGDKANDPTQYMVTLSYDASTLPIWNFYPPLPLPSPIIRFSSTIRRGGI